MLRVKNLGKFPITMHRRPTADEAPVREAIKAKLKERLAGEDRMLRAGKFPGTAGMVLDPGVREARGSIGILLQGGEAVDLEEELVSQEMRLMEQRRVVSIAPVN